MAVEKSFMDLKCNKCGYTVGRLMLLALMVDAGAKVYPSPSKCIGGKEHDFLETKKEE